MDSDLTLMDSYSADADNSIGYSTTVIIIRWSAAWFQLKQLLVKIMFHVITIAYNVDKTIQ